MQLVHGAAVLDSATGQRGMVGVLRALRTPKHSSSG